MAIEEFFLIIRKCLKANDLQRRLSSPATEEPSGFHCVDNLSVVFERLATSDFTGQGNFDVGRVKLENPRTKKNPFLPAYEANGKTPRSMTEEL